MIQVDYLVEVSSSSATGITTYRRIENEYGTMLIDLSKVLFAYTTDALIESSTSTLKVTSTKVMHFVFGVDLEVVVEFTSEINDLVNPSKCNCKMAKRMLINEDYKWNKDDFTHYEYVNTKNNELKEGK